MNLVDPQLLDKNCAGDPSMMRELINMGLLSINNSVTDIGSSLEAQDWDRLARVLHKLRPILCYCGINCLTDTLLHLEEDAKARKNLPELATHIQSMIGTLHLAKSELEQQLRSLSS